MANLHTFVREIVVEFERNQGKTCANAHSEQANSEDAMKQLLPVAIGLVLSLGVVAAQAHPFAGA